MKHKHKQKGLVKAGPIPTNDQPPEGNLLSVEPVWKFTADSLSSLADYAENQADALLRHQLSPDGTELKKETVQAMEKPLQALAIGHLGMNLRNGMVKAANSYRQLVAYISFRQPDKKTITAGLLTAGFPNSRVSEIIRLAFAPEDVLTAFLRGDRSFWDSLKLARGTSDDAKKPTPAGGAASSATATNADAVFAANNQHPLLTNQLATCVFNRYATATGIPMLEVKATIPLGDTTGFDKTTLLAALSYLTQVDGFGGFVATFKRI